MHPLASRRDNPNKFYLVRVRLDRQGYSPDGQYFGVGAPLYEYWNEDYSMKGHVRANDRDAAKRKIRAERRVPEATFHR